MEKVGKPATIAGGHVGRDPCLARHVDECSISNARERRDSKYTGFLSAKTKAPEANNSYSPRHSRGRKG